MRENEVAKSVLDAAFAVHTALGPGLLESVYQAALTQELRLAGFRVAEQVPQPVQYRGLDLGIGYRLDLLVEGCVVVELKSVDTLHPVFHKQLLSYLKTSGYKLGLLINFNTDHLRDGIARKVNGL